MPIYVKATNKQNNKVLFSGEIVSNLPDEKIIELGQKQFIDDGEIEDSDLKNWNFEISTEGLK